MTSTMTWRPLLEGDLAAHAEATARAILDDLAADPALPAVDAALLWPYVAAALPDRDDAARHDAALDAVVELIPTTRDPALHGGLAGLGFVLAHTVEDPSAVLDPLDAALLAALRAEPRWPGQYDLISGLVGLGVYFLERGLERATAATAGLDLIVAHLANLAEHTPHGVTWHTPPNLLTPHQRDDAPTGYYNCGLAHGVPGVIAILGRVAARSDLAAATMTKAATLRDAAIDWLAAHALPDPGAHYPTRRIPDETPTASRTAWCYGDPGVLAALWQADALAGRPIDDHLPRLLAALGRSRGDTGVLDAALCHGAAGLGHIANRAYQASGNPRLRDAAIRWFTETLTFRDPDLAPGQGHGGYQIATRDPATGEPLHRANPDLLDGAAGIALALLAAIGREAPAWDRLLLLELP
jgi:hypothetical protein